MSTFKQLQRKSPGISSPAAPTSSLLRPSHPFAPVSINGSQKAHPDWQA